MVTKPKKSKATGAPRCRICQTDHWLRDGCPVPKGEVKPAVPEVPTKTVKVKGKRKDYLDQASGAVAAEVNARVDAELTPAMVEAGAVDQYRHQKAYRVRNPEKYRDYMKDYMRDHRPSRAKG